MLLLAATSSALKIIFLVHLVFVTWGLQSDWAPVSYFFYNLLFLVILLWGMHQHDSEHPILMALFMNIVCVFLDVVTVGVFFPPNSNSAAKRFSAGMAIVNLLLRPVSSFFLYRILQERHSQYGDLSFGGTTIGGMFAAPRRSPYEDIDRVHVPSQSVPATSEPVSPSK